MPPSSNLRFLAWLTLLVAGSVALTLGFACAAPLAAIGAAAALILPRHQALTATAAVWCANQAVGFVVLGYPWTADCLAWGAVLAVAALGGCVAAQATAARLSRLGAVPVGVAAFAAAFVAYEVLLFVPAAAVLSGIEDFTAPIQMRILGINGAAFAGLLALAQLCRGSGIGSKAAPSLYPAARRA